MKNALKYIKISLILTSVCLVCALGVAGVNFVTGPVIEEHDKAAKMEGYKEIFPELDLTNSDIIASGFKSDSVKEKVVVRNANNEQLGYVFNTKGKNTYGPISLIVGFDNEGKLLKLVCTENGQTGGRADMINEYLKSFTEGMTPSDINNLPVYAGATFGSKLVKSLINAALAELGIKTDLQKELEGVYGEAVDMNNTVEVSSFIYAKQMKSGYIVKDAAKNVLGYYYKANVLGVNYTIALNSEYNNILETGATPLVNKLAASEAKGVADEELIIELLFGGNFETEAMEIAEDVKVSKGTKVLDKTSKALIGYLFAVEGSVKVPGTDEAKLALLVGLNADASYAGAFITENGQTEGRADKVTEFVGSLEGGMSGLDVLLKDPVAGATKGSDLAKDLIAEAVKAVTGKKPEKPAEGYNALYEKAFEGVSLANSKKLETIKDVTKQIKEGMILNNAEGKLLGYAYVIKSNENKLGGTLDLFVSVNADNTLNKVTVLKNAQTSGFDKNLAGYENQFTNGMNSSAVESVPNCGATLGSLQMKELIKLALGEQDGGLVKYFVEAFPGIDLSKSEIAGAFGIKQPQVESKITAKDAEGNILGYGVIVNLENVYSKNKMLVTLDAEKKFAKLIDIQNNHASMDDIKVDGLVGKGSIAEVDAYFAELIKSGSSFSNDMARLGIIIAFEEITGNPYAQNNAVLGEDLLKQIYPNMVAVHSSLDAEYVAKNSGVLNKIIIKGSAHYQDKVQIGTAYLIIVENEHDQLKVLVGLDEANNFVGARVLTATADDVIDYQFFQSRMADYMNKYLVDSFRAGMTQNDIMKVKNYHGAQYASQILKHALCMALNEANKYAPALAPINSYNNTEAYYNAIAGIDFSKTVSNMDNVDKALYPNILDAIVAKDSSGNFLANAYIVYVNDIYSHNYIMVLLDNSNNLLGVYDVQNDHGALEQFLPMFTPGWAPITEQDIKDLNGYLNSDSSFTIEVIRRGVLTAMEVNAKAHNEALARENAARAIFPLMVSLRSFDVKVINTPSKVVFAKEIHGSKNYQDGQFLGYVYELAVNENLTITVSATTDGKLFVPGNRVNYVINKNNTGVENSAILEFLAKFGAEVNTDAQIDAVENGSFALAADIKLALKEAIKEANEHTSKTPYDVIVKNLFPTYSYAKSEHLDSRLEDNPYKFNNSEIFYAEKAMDAEGNFLGYAYVMNIKNAYSKNTVVVAVDKDGKFVGFQDYVNTHASVDLVDYSGIVGKNDIQEINKYFDDVKAAMGHATYTVDMAKYAVRVALNEFLQGANNEITYEVYAKKIFSFMVSFHSSEIDKSSFKNDSIIYGINVKGTKNFQDNQDLGKAYVIKESYREGDITIMIGLDTEGKFVGAYVIDSNIQNNKTHTGNLASKAQLYLEHFAGYEAKDVNSVPNQAGELYIDFLVKNIVLTAFAEFNGEKANNLFNIDEAVFKEAFANAFGVYDESKSEIKKDGFLNSEILRSLKAVKRNGEVLGTAYFMFYDNVYGRNYIVVVLDNEGNFKKFVDVQNDHAAISGNDVLFHEGMNEAQIEAIVHAGGSFTTEILKLSVLTAMSEYKGELLPSVEMEQALKNLYPYIVMQRTHELDIQADTKVKAGYFVGGVSWYQTNKELGYAYLVEVNENLQIMVAVDLQNKLFLGYDHFIMSTLGYIPASYTIVKNNTNIEDASINAFLAKFGAGIETAEAIDAVENGEFSLALDVKAALKAVLTEAKRHKLLTNIDATIRGEFPTLSDVKSVINTPKQLQVKNSVTIKNSKDELIGYAVIVALKNTWCDFPATTVDPRPNIMLVTLDANGNYLNLIDIENHHANMNDQAPNFAGCHTMEEIDAKLVELQALGHGTMSSEMAALGIKVAMTEATGLNDAVRYEALAKEVFIGMIAAHSNKITPNGEIVAGYVVKGITGFGPLAPIGKVYALKNSESHLLVAIDNNGAIVKVFDLNNNDSELEVFVGATKDTVNTVDSPLKDLVAKVFAEGGNK